MWPARASVLSQCLADPALGELVLTDDDPLGIDPQQRVDAGAFTGSGCWPPMPPVTITSISWNVSPIKVRLGAYC